MNISFETALSTLAKDPTDLIAWSVVLDAFTRKVSDNRMVNGKALDSDLTLELASSDFANQGTVFTVLHGNANGNPTWRPVTNDDITDSTITLGKVQAILNGRILGRISANSGTIEQLTGTQLTSLLDLFDDASTTQGLVPGSNNASNSYFLRADKTWAIPPSTTHSSLNNLSYAAAGHTGFEPTISGGTALQYWRGDKTWHTFPIASVATLGMIKVGTNLTIDLNGVLNASAGGGGGAGDWGSIGGNIGDQGDLAIALGLLAPIDNPTFTGSVAGTFIGNITGNVTGNADTATTTTNATNAESLVTTNFSIVQDGSTLLIKYDGSTIITIDSTGHITATDFILG